MKTPISALVVSALLLSACGESRLNPFNWFGGGQEEETLELTAEAREAAIDRRGLVEEVISLRIDRTNGGAVIHAVGLPATQGYFDAELVAHNDGQPTDGVLTYLFRIERPLGFERVVNQRSREVTVAAFLSDIALEGITSIRVVAQGNSMVSRR